MANSDVRDDIKKELEKRGITREYLLSIPDKRIEEIKNSNLSPKKKAALIAQWEKGKKKFGIR